MECYADRKYGASDHEIKVEDGSGNPLTFHSLSTIGPRGMSSIWVRKAPWRRDDTAPVEVSIGSVDP